MGRGNDAIPTWSGFNYQGKMMLLYVLELINQIAKDKNKDIDAYSVELEKTEDFCIICDSEYKSFHQVKAYLSKDKWNSYSKAMDKLLKHRAESNNPTAKCYLTVAKEIKDWDDASNTYNVSVELYKRASKVVGVCDVRNEIDAIKIPLMVYSGRIIQNYPLGLGIRAVIKTNQLVFEAASKSGSDVYNILSTGQLNGLSIALLLSIKNVYGDTKGLDILLIDDPLQTIDDISAISLADLLTQQGIGQIVLSTHEEAKAALLRYKFKHAGMSVREQNMQALYMKTVTEE